MRKGSGYASVLAGLPVELCRRQAETILVGYNLVWMFNPWNGPGGPWAPGNENIGSAFDRWLLGRNYSGFYVGMNAIPSTATIIGLCPSKRNAIIRANAQLTRRRRRRSPAFTA